MTPGLIRRALATRTIVGFILAALSVVAATAIAQDRPLVPLDILVRDIYGKVLASARIQILNNWTSTKTETVTGTDGRAFVWVTPGSHRITVSLPGYGSLTASSFCVLEGEPAHFHAALGPDRDGTASRPTTPPRPASVSPISLPTTAVMSEAELREAMEFGRKSTKLAGYPLTSSRGLVRSNVGMLFTPFLRMATATQVADASKKTFAESEIPRWLLERVAWIAVAPAEHVGSEEDAQRYMAAPSEVVIEPNGDRNRRKAIVPAWAAHLNTPCDSEVYESILGHQFPWPGMIAAFPMDVLKDGHVIAVTFPTLATARGGPGAIKISQETKRVRIRAQDLRDWR